MQWMTLMIIFYGMTVKRMGMLGVSVRKMTLTLKVETVRLIGKDRI